MRTGTPSSCCMIGPHRPTTSPLPTRDGYAARSLRRTQVSDIRSLHRPVILLDDRALIHLDHHRKQIACHATSGRWRAHAARRQCECLPACLPMRKICCYPATRHPIFGRPGVAARSARGRRGARYRARLRSAVESQPRNWASERRANPAYRRSLPVTGTFRGSCARLAPSLRNVRCCPTSSGCRLPADCAPPYLVEHPRDRSW